MDISQKLRGLLEAQRQQGAELEAALSELEAADFLRENDQLRLETGELRQELEAKAAETAKLRQENQSLRERLSEQIYSQRGGLLQSARKQSDILFAQEEDRAVNRLAGQNAQIRERLAALRAQLEGRGGEARELLEEIARLEDAARQYMRSASGALEQGFREERARADEAYQALEREPITPEQVAGKLRRNSLELRIGGKITVIVGVFFILLAVALGLRYTYLYLLKSDWIKGLLAYLIGVLFLGGGELAGRKGRTPFSIGLCAGGVAILFTATAVSYFSLGILPMGAAVGVCIAVTALALLQSIRHNSQLIAVFALIGGYLPMSAVDRTPTLLISAMAYFLLLNLFVLLVASRKSWQPLKFFSFSLGALGTAYLFFGGEPPIGLAAGLLYALANLLLYTAIVLIRPIMQNGALRRSDVVLLGLNTAFGCGFFYGILGVHGYRNLFGAVAVGICLLYFLFAQWLRRVLPRDGGAHGVFFATSFAFWALAVPLQFEPRLVSLGWLFESVALWVFGVFSDRKWYRRAGMLLAQLCVLCFLLRDMLFGYWFAREVFVWRYGAVTLGLVVIFATALYRFFRVPAYWESTEGKGIQVLKRIALANSWFYCLFLPSYLLDLHMKDLLWEQFWRMLAFSVLTVGIGVLLRAAAPLRDRVVSGLSNVLYALGLLWALALSACLVPTPQFVPWLCGIILLIACMLAATGFLYEWLRHFAREGRLHPEMPGLIASVYALILAVQLTRVQAGFPFQSMAISFVLILWALGMIVFGFQARYSIMRRFGLGLSLAAISKLFLFDLSHLQSGQRILSYFVFGLVFIAISFVYQLFSKRLFPAAEQSDESA